MFTNVYKGPACALLVAGALGAGAGHALAQDAGALTLGEVVRIDHDFVGTLMSIEDGGHLRVMGAGKPTCRASLRHAEAPICDPAPTVWREVEWSDATVERQLVEIAYTRRMIVGFILGAAVAGPIGYATGPSLGYGEVSACVTDPNEPCNDPVSREELDQLQRSQDQKRGAGFFGVVGGTIGAIIARRTANEWVEVQPPRPGVPSDGWTVGVRVPTGGR